MNQICFLKVLVGAERRSLCYCIRSGFSCAQETLFIIYLVAHFKHHKTSIKVLKERERETKKESVNGGFNGTPQSIDKITHTLTPR